MVKISSAARSPVTISSASCSASGVRSGDTLMIDPTSADVLGTVTVPQGHTTRESTREARTRNGRAPSAHGHLSENPADWYMEEA